MMDLDSEFNINIKINGDICVIQEEQCEAVEFKVCTDSFESIAHDVGEAIKDYLEGLF
jgi:hypothetical protein